MPMTEFTIGICAFNEAGNIGRCIDSIYEQKFNGFVLKEVIVVSSASTDDTDDIVREKIASHPNLRLITQKERKGKNSAINEFLDTKQTEIVVIVNADNILKDEDSIQYMLEPFNDDKVGIVGGHPIAVNSKKTVAGFASNMIWVLHHHIALISPKIGELIAYRDIGTRLPEQFQSDEDYIRKRIEDEGYRVEYAPKAETYIRGPDTISDLIKQRSRVNIGQSYMVKNESYYNPSRDVKVLMRIMSDTMKDLGFHPFKMIASVAIELYCRMKGKMYVRSGKDDMSIWDPAMTTKKL